MWGLSRARCGVTAQSERIRLAGVCVFHQGPEAGTTALWGMADRRILKGVRAAAPLGSCQVIP